MRQALLAISLLSLACSSSNIIERTGNKDHIVGVACVTSISGTTLAISNNVRETEFKVINIDVFSSDRYVAHLFIQDASIDEAIEEALLMYPKWRHYTLEVFADSEDNFDAVDRD